MNSHSMDTGKKREFDWQSVRERIAAANASLTDSDEISPELLHKIWARRAAQLAEVPPQEDESEHIQLVLFRLGREIYGVNAQHVFDIRPAELITHVPRVPDWVTGVVNLRGRVLSVVDLRRFFGLPHADSADGKHPADGRHPADERHLDEDTGSEPVEETHHLMVVETPNMEVALLTDEVLKIEALPTSQIRDTAGTVRGLRPEYVRGVVTRENEDADAGKNSAMLVVLDLPALLGDERLIIHEEVV
jgi:purine-binding chemotaxis protein CheW